MLHSNGTPTLDNDRSLSIGGAYNLLHRMVVAGPTLRLAKDSARLLVEASQGLDLEARRILAEILAAQGGLVPLKTLLDALAESASAGQGGSDVLHRLYRTTLPDLGRIACLLREKGHIDTVLTGPLIGTLVPKEEIGSFENIDEAWKAMRPYEGLVVQGKFLHGKQVQVHKSGPILSVLDAQGEDVAPRFPMIASELTRRLATDQVILDAEILAIDPRTNRVLPHSEILSAKDHLVAVYDAIALNGDDLRHRQYRARRALLEDLIDPLVHPCPGLFLVEEATARAREEAQALYSSYVSREYYQGVVVKLPQGTVRSGLQSHDRARILPYTILDSVLIGFNSRGPSSYLVGLWETDERRTALPYRRVETVVAEAREQIAALCEARKSKQRPQWVGAGPVPEWYLSEALVVMVRCAGVIQPNDRETYMGLDWVLLDGSPTSIIGIYGPGKEANTCSRLYSLKRVSG